MALGGFVAQTGYTPVLLLSAVAPVVSGALIMGLLREPARSFMISGEEAPTFAATLVSAVRALRVSRPLRRVFVQFVGLITLFGTIDEFPGTLLAELNETTAPGVLPLGIIGLLYGAFLGSQSVGAALAHRFQALAPRRIATVSLLAHGLLLAALGAGVWVAWPSGGVMLCAGVAVYFALMGAVEVLLETSLQHEIDTAARATITSASSAAMDLGGVLLYLLIGSVAASASWVAALAVVATLAVLMSLAFTYPAGPSAVRSRS
jgi:hypothetical protein